MGNYYTIDYQIRFLSDLHVGDGTTLISGNFQGVRKDEFGVPYMPFSQVKGLLRLGGSQLMSWNSLFLRLFKRNFGKQEDSTNMDRVRWSYTSARYPVSKRNEARGAASMPTYSAEMLFEGGLIGRQAHIKSKQGIAENLFAFQKSGGNNEDFRKWEGHIFSINEADEEDVAFLIACMKAEDRIGARRSRGYGKVSWGPIKIGAYKQDIDKQNTDGLVLDSASSTDLLNKWYEKLFNTRGGK